MTIDRIVRALAGFVVFAGLALSPVHHINRLWLTAFVGANPLRSAFAGFRPPAKRAGVRAAGAAWRSSNAPAYTQTRTRTDRGRT